MTTRAPIAPGIALFMQGGMAGAVPLPHQARATIACAAVPR
jgi:hypothetical protein